MLESIKDDLVRLVKDAIHFPILASLFVVDFALLFFLARIPLILTIIMVPGLVALSVYFGGRLALEGGGAARKPGK